MKRNFNLTFFFLFMAMPLFSQNFTREAGLRGGLTSGFTYRHYLDDYLSYEGILSFRKSGIQFTMLRQINEINRFIEFGTGLNFLYGFGGHVGFFYSDNYKPFGLSRFYYPNRRFSPVLGVDAYTGLEYRMESIPIVFGIDYKPFFEFSLYQYFKLQFWDFAFSARYRF